MKNDIKRWQRTLRNYLAIITVLFPLFAYAEAGKITCPSPQSILINTNAKAWTGYMSNGVVATWQYDLGSPISLLGLVLTKSNRAICTYNTNNVEQLGFIMTVSQISYAQCKLSREDQQTQMGWMCLEKPHSASCYISCTVDKNKK